MDSVSSPIKISQLVEILSSSLAVLMKRKTYVNLYTDNARKNFNACILTYMYK